MKGSGEEGDIAEEVAEKAWGDSIYSCSVVSPVPISLSPAQKSQIFCCQEDYGVAEA